MSSSRRRGRRVAAALGAGALLVGAAWWAGPATGHARDVAVGSRGGRDRRRGDGGGHRPTRTRPTTSAPATTGPASSTTRPDTRSTTTTTTIPPSTRPPCDATDGACPRDRTAEVRAAGLGNALPTDLADSGEIVGTADAEGVDTAFRLPAAGPARRLAGLPGDGATQAMGVNTAARWWARAGPPTARIPWCGAPTRVVDLGPRLPRFGGRLVEGYATAVNDRGLVAGTYGLGFEDPVDTTPPPTDAPVSTRWPTTVAPATTVPTTPATDPPTTTGPTVTRPSTTSWTGPTTAPPPTTTPTTEPPFRYREVYLAFVWDPATDAVRILNPGELASRFTTPWVAVLDLGAGGHVVGQFDEHAVRWTLLPDGTSSLDDLGLGAAVAVTATGTAVGVDAEGRAVSWPPGTTSPVALPGRAVPGPGDRFDVAGVNDRLTVVGSLADGVDRRRPCAGRRRPHRPSSCARRTPTPRRWPSTRPAPSWAWAMTAPGGGSWSGRPDGRRSLTGRAMPSPRDDGLR